MGTRGVIGFTADGKDHCMYNHYDSYPEYLGQRMVDFVSTKVAKAPKTYMLLVDNLEAVSGKPTQDQIDACKAFTDLHVSTQSTDDWYCLLRDTQGDPEAILQCGLYEDSRDFLADSLFCEYAYIVNFDTGMLEMYIGWQKEPHDRGRFADMPTDGKYYPVALVAEFPFDQIPDDWKRYFDEDYVSQQIGFNEHVSALKEQR